jgi:hypothetical protein
MKMVRGKRWVDFDASLPPSSAVLGARSLACGCFVTQRTVQPLFCSDEGSIPEP